MINSKITNENNILSRAIELRDYAISKSLSYDEVIDIVNRIRELPSLGSVSFAMRLDEISNEVCNHYNNLFDWKIF